MKPSDHTKDSTGHRRHHPLHQSGGLGRVMPSQGDKGHFTFLSCRLAKAGKVQRNTSHFTIPAVTKVLEFCSPVFESLSVFWSLLCFANPDVEGSPDVAAWAVLSPAPVWEENPCCSSKCRLCSNEHQALLTQ